jgi:hypothetical protein
MRFRSRLHKASLGAGAIALSSIALGVVPASGKAAAASPVFEFQRAGTSFCLQGQINSQITNVTCNASSPAQRWTAVTFNTVGMLFVSQAPAGPCMTVHNNLTIPGAPVEGEECSQDLNKFWVLISTTAPSNGTFVVQNLNSHLCLAIFSGTFLGQDNCDLTSSNQTFRLNPV